MADIYDQHRAAFKQVSAYVVMHGADRVATIAFKFPRDGAGRLYAYVQWLGLPMVRGYAGGFGYDKRSAACVNARHKFDRNTMVDRMPDYADRPWCAHYAAFIDALAIDDGYDWSRNLEKAGFTVFQAV